MNAKKQSTETATERLSRLLTMVPWLLNRQGVEIEEVAREFGVTSAQVEADLALLFLFGTPGGYHGALIAAEWERGRVFLGNAEPDKRPPRPGVGRGGEASGRLSPRSVCHLVVVLAIAGAPVSGKAGDRAPMAPAPAGRLLPVVHERVLQRLLQIGHGPEIGVVAVALTGEDRVDRVMEVVAPLRVDAVAAALARRDDTRVVQVALGDEETSRSARDRVDAGRQLLQAV